MFLVKTEKGKKSKLDSMVNRNVMYYKFKLINLGFDHTL